MTYIISYDLNRPRQEYNDLYKAIKDASTGWCHPLDSTWFITSNLTAVQVRDRLNAVTDSSDAVIVATVSSPAAWFGLTQELTDWLNNNL